MFKIASALALTSTIPARAFSVLSVSSSSLLSTKLGPSSSSLLVARRAAAAAAAVQRTMATTTESPVSNSSPTAATTADQNPLLQQAGLPKFASIDPSHVTPAVTTLLTQLEADLAQLEQDLQQQQQPSVQYDQVVPVVERMQFPLGYAWGVTGHLNGVKNGEALRQAYEANQPAIVKTFSKFSQSKPLFDALTAIAESPELQHTESSSGADFVQQQRRRAVEHSLRAMKLGGVGLEGADKERFNESKLDVICFA